MCLSSEELNAIFIYNRWEGSELKDGETSKSPSHIP